MGRSVMLALALSSIGCNQVFGISPLGPCRDEDGDGYDTCLPDCDDTNAAIRPDQPEICGNAIDDDCDGAPDQYCQGLGTFVSEHIGNDSNPGTQEQPLATINQALAQAQQIGHGVDVYIGEGLYPEDVALVEGVSLFGGFACQVGSCDWTERVRPPNQTISCIMPAPQADPPDVDGVTADASITRDTVLDGICIDGLFGFENGPRFAAFTIDGGAPIFRNSFIAPAGWLADPPLLCDLGFSVEILSSGDTPLLIEDSTIMGPECGGDPGLGEMVAVQVSGNGKVEIRRSEVVINFAQKPYAIRLQDQARASIQESNIGGGGCVGVALGEQSLAVRIEDAARAVIDRSYINRLPLLCAATDGDTDFSNNPWCAGVSVEKGSLTLTNSVVYGLHTPRSAAVWVAAGPQTDVVINGNILVGSPPGDRMFTPPYWSAALVVDTIGGDYAAGRYRNNVLRGGSAALMTRFGVFEQGQGAHPRIEALSHNNIIEVDVAYRSWNGVSESLLNAVADLTSLSFASDNFGEDCLLDIEFRLAPGSPCIDRGTAEEAPDHDFEGEPRPNGAAIDVGVDELHPRE
ncbi:MAG TPA: MopE-related protein [Polyangiaceae bacterium]|nr:MopE-related protein [Polyangiaceae bacterium]